MVRKLKGPGESVQEQEVNKYCNRVEPATRQAISHMLRSLEKTERRQSQGESRSQSRGEMTPFLFPTCLFLKKRDFVHITMYLLGLSPATGSSVCW